MALVIIEICLLVLVFGRGETVVPYNDVKSDYETLITAYRTNGSVSATNVMPNDPTVAPIVVYLGMSLYAVMDYDGVSGRIQLVASMNIEWFDEVKVLAGTTFKESLQTIFVPYDQIWTPNLVLINAAERIGDDTYKVRYNVSSGYCKWNPRMIINAACTPDMTFYPFDKQTCVLTVSAWFRDNSVLNLVALTNEWNIGYLEKSGIWDVHETSTVAYTDTVTGLYNTDFKITVKRKPLFLALVIVLPVLLLSLLTGFVFLLPPGSGSRVGFGITCFLSFIVLLQIVMNFIPEVSSPMPLLCVYIIGMLAFSVLLSITNVILLNMYLNSSKDEVPRWLLSAVEIIECKILRRCPKHPKPKLCQPIPGNITRQDTVHNIRFTGRSNGSKMFKLDKNNEAFPDVDKECEVFPKLDKQCTVRPEFCEDINVNQELSEKRSNIPEFDKEGREFPKEDKYSRGIRELDKECRMFPEELKGGTETAELQFANKGVFPEVDKDSSEILEVTGKGSNLLELDTKSRKFPEVITVGSAYPALYEEGRGFPAMVMEGSEIAEVKQDGSVLSEFDKESRAISEVDTMCNEIEELDEDSRSYPAVVTEANEIEELTKDGSGLSELDKEHTDLPKLNDESTSPLELDKEVRDFPEVDKLCSELAELEEDDRVVSELDNACGRLPGWDEEETDSFNSDSRREHDNQNIQNTLFVVENSKQLHRTTSVVVNSSQFDHDDSKITPVEHPNVTLQTRSELCRFEEKTTTPVSTARSKPSNPQSKNEITWEYIAHILDTFFLVIFSAVQIIFTIFFLVPCAAQY